MHSASRLSRSFCIQRIKSIDSILYLQWSRRNGRIMIFILLEITCQAYWHVLTAFTSESHFHFPCSIMGLSVWVLYTVISRMTIFCSTRSQIRDGWLTWVCSKPKHPRSGPPRYSWFQGTWSSSWILEAKFRSKIFAIKFLWICCSNRYLVCGNGFASFALPISNGSMDHCKSFRKRLLAMHRPCGWSRSLESIGPATEYTRWFIIFERKIVIFFKMFRFKSWMSVYRKLKWIFILGPHWHRRKLIFMY